MIEELQIDYRASLVCLTCAVAFIGTHTAVSMCEQYRLALSTSMKSFQIYGIAILLVVLHLVEHNIRLRTSEGAVINVEFDQYLVLASVLVSSFLIWISILIASQDEYFNKSQTEIMNNFLTRALTKRTIVEIKHLGKRQILFLVCMSSLKWILLGGIIAGGSLCLARYIAILSNSFPGVVEYNMGLLALSIILSFAGMIILFWIYFRTLTVFNNMGLLRIACSILGIIVLSHYIRIFLSKFLYNPEHIHLQSSRYEENGDIFIGIITSAALFSFLLISFALWYLRVWLQDTSTQLYQADRAIISMLNSTINDTDGNHTIATARTMYTGSNGTIETPRDNIQVKDTTIHTPEVVKYARQYLLQSECLSEHFRQQILHSPTHNYPVNTTNQSTELPPLPFPEESNILQPLESRDNTLTVEEENKEEKKEEHEQQKEHFCEP